MTSDGLRRAARAAVWASVLAGLGGCAAARMPAITSIPPSVAFDVRKKTIWLYSIHPDYRRRGCEDLGQMGPLAEPVVPFLIGALGDEGRGFEGPPVGDAAAAALALVGEKAVVPLTAGLKDSWPAVRRRACGALGQIKDARAVGPLIDLLAEGGPAAEDAQKALGAITGQSLGRDAGAWRAWHKTQPPPGPRQPEGDRPATRPATRPAGG